LNGALQAFLEKSFEGESGTNPTEKKANDDETNKPE
jgi:hypothetical protein